MTDDSYKCHYKSGVKSAQNKGSSQKGIIPLIVIFIALVVIGAGTVGVKSGLLKLTAAPSNPGSPVGPFDRLPEKSSTPTPSAQQSKTDFQKDVPKPTLSPETAQKSQGGWQTYNSSKYGYSVTYPVGWELLDGNTDTSRQIMIKEKSNLGYVDIQAFFDKTLAEPGKVQAAINALEQKFRSDQSLKVAQFKSSVEGKVGGYITTGEQTINGNQYNFENRGLLGTSGKILLFHGAYKKTAPADYLQKIEKIITSFKTD